MNLIKKYENNRISFIDGQQTILFMDEVQKDDTVEIIIGGELRSETYHVFQDELHSIISVDMNLILNFKDVEYISASYMKVLVSAEQAIEKKGKMMKLIHVPQNVIEVFQKSGAADLLRIEWE